MYEDTLLPYALSLGINYYDFWKMNPKILRIIARGHEQKLDEIDYLMWVMGMYVRSAVSTSIEHVFVGENAKSSYVEYPYRHEKQEDEAITANNESKEQVAVFEMKQRINLLRQQGLPESPI